MIREVTAFPEFVIDEAGLPLLRPIGYSIVQGELGAERKDSGQAFLDGYQSETLPGAS